MMETRLLKYFTVLADELHFGKAAKKLHISQLPLSRNVMNICHRAGFSPKVFIRSHHINSIVKLVEKNIGYAIVPIGPKAVFKESVKLFELKNYPERSEISLAYNSESSDDISKKAVEKILNHDYR